MATLWATMPSVTPAVQLKQAVRRGDLLARIGGEEFALVMRNTDEWGAIMVAERVREFISVAPANTNAGKLNLTASVGVSSLRTSDRDPDAALRRADDALYRAKEEGRNCVRATTMELLPPIVA
jgi:diguanylate cyclase (GGDEF)-like protein